MTDPNKPQPSQPRKQQYEALGSFALTGTGRQVTKGQTFEATDEEITGLVEGKDFKRAQKP